MLSTFLEKAEGLLNRRFLVVYWFPTFLVAVIAGALRVWVYGFGAAWTKWQGLIAGEDNSAQLWLLLAFLLVVTLLAYLLQAFTRPIVQVCEGYRWPEPIRRWRTGQQVKRWAACRAKALAGLTSGQDCLFHRFPFQAAQLMPTRLGNVIKAAERYGAQVYGMDVPFWWPRLWTLLPETEQQAVEDALASLVVLLNLGLLLLYTTIDGAIYLWRSRYVMPYNWVLVGIVGLGLAWLCYEAAVVQAQSYGQRLRASVDLHRLELLKTLQVPAPKTPTEERACWEMLTAWMYTYDRGAIHNLQYAETKQEEEKE